MFKITELLESSSVLTQPPEKGPSSPEISFAKHHKPYLSAPLPVTKLSSLPITPLSKDKIDPSLFSSTSSTSPVSTSPTSLTSSSESPVSTPSTTSPASSFTSPSHTPSTTNSDSPSPIETQSLTGSIQKKKLVSESMNESPKKKEKFLKKHGDELSTFFKKIAGLKEDDELSQAAKEALKHLEGDLFASSETMDEALESCLNVYLLCLDRDATADPMQFTSPTFLKRLDKVDRLLGRKPKVFSFINKFISSGALAISASVLQATDSGTANISYFVSEKPGKKQMLYKPAQSEKQVFSVIDQGKGYRRQVIAYLLDRMQGGLVSVPISLGAYEDPLGLGSIQGFRKNHGDLASLPAKDIAKISIPSFQNTALLRLRMYDLDGHLGNFLWKQDKDGDIQLIPIDFDYALPSLKSSEDVRAASLKLGIRFFPQADQRLQESVRASLLEIDPEKEAEVLSSLGFSESERTLLKHTTCTLQEMAKAGFTIGEMIDELSSAAFKTSVIEPESDNIKKSVEDRVQALLENQKELAAKRKTAIDEIVGGSSENASYRARTLFESDQDLRGALMVIHELLDRFPNETTTLETINQFKNYYSADANGFYAFFTAIAMKMDQVGMKDKAIAIRKWLVDEA